MKTETLGITGMTCDGCTSKVAHALNAVAGVHEVVVSLAAGEAAVRYDEHQTAHDHLKSAVESAGYGVVSTNTAPAQPSKGGCCN